MNQEKEKGAKDPKEVSGKCSKTKCAASKSAPKAITAHAGLRLKFDKKKKLTIVKPFSFDTNPKTEKGNPSKVPQKSVEKQTISEGQEGSTVISSDATDQIGVRLDVLKISKSAEIKTIEKTKEIKISTEKTSKTPTHDILKDKKACSRCSRAKKEESVKLSKTPDQPLKAAKAPSTQHTKTVACKTQCPKLGKLQDTKTCDKSPVITKAKPSSIKAVTNRDKEISKVRREKSENVILNNEKVKSTTGSLKNSNRTLEEKVEIVISESEDYDVSQNSRNLDSRACNGVKPESNGVTEALIEERSELLTKVEEYESSFVSVTRSETEFGCGPNHEYEFSNGIKKESDGIKTASKIPRIAQAPPGIKIPANMKKDMVSQPTNFENVCPNAKIQTINEVEYVVN